MKSGYLDLIFTTAPPTDRGPDGQDPWKGISGTALFTEDGALLTGVRSHRLPAAGTGSAGGEPVAAALTDPESVRLLELDGIPPQAVEAEPPGNSREKVLNGPVPMSTQGKRVTARLDDAAAP